MTQTPPHPPTRRVLTWLALTLLACTFGFDPNAPPPQPVTPGMGATSETGRVVRVIDGDTIDVELNGQVFRVRYVGVNTPERDETCYRPAVDANRLLVEGKTARLVRDVSDTDRFGRLLRYVYVGDLFVNQVLVEQGYAEAVLYEPDRAHYDLFRRLEQEARAAGRGCHPTGIFDDGSDTR